MASIARATASPRQSRRRALARPQLREHASLEDAREFLHPLQGMERVESEPGVYRWREVTADRMAEIEFEALQPKDLVLHR